MSQNEVNPTQAIQVALAVYDLEDSPNIAAAFKTTDLAKYFDFGSQAAGQIGAQRFTARSGAFEFKCRTGFAVMAMGKKTTQYEGHAILVCRGTASAYDWLTDVNYAVVLGTSGTSVHSGFNRTFQDMKDGFAGFLAQNNPRHVHCIGHSLGGALATLAAEWLSHSGYGVDLYTFGAPRVGTERFAVGLTSKVGRKNIYRVCHSSDPVTMVPVWPYMHAPRPDGECWVNRSVGVNVGAHRIRAYVDTIGENESWTEFYCPTPSMFLEYSVNLWSVDSLGQLLTIAPLLAFSAILRILCRGLAITLQPGISLLDQSAIWVEQAANLSIEGEGRVRTFLQAIAKLVGMNLVEQQRIAHEDIKRLFRAFLWVRYHTALKAAASADGE